MQYALFILCYPSCEHKTLFQSNIDDGEAVEVFFTTATVSISDLIGALNGLHLNMAKIETLAKKMEAEAKENLS